MAVELKEEMRSEGTQEQAPQSPIQTNGIQIQLSPEMEKVLVMIVKEDYEASKSARDEKDYGISSKGEKLNFEKWLKGLRDLYNSRREAKTEPWKFCSNRSLRTATSILDLLHARLLPAIVNDEFIRWRANKIQDYQKVERISKLMYWWIWVHNRMRGFFDNWVKTILGYGDTLTEATWKVVPIDSGERQKIPITDEMGQPIMNPDGTPAVQESINLTFQESSESKIYQKEQVFLQKGSKDIQREPVVIEEEILYRDLEQGETEGKFMNVSNLLRTMIPIAKEVTTGLSDEEAERVTRVKLRNHPVKILKAYLNFDADGDGFDEDIRVYICPEYDLYLGGVPTRLLTKSGKRPINFTKLESRIDRPEENDGEGILEKIKELSDEIDAIFNQLSDSNTLSILRPGFYDPAGDLDAPVLKIAPNRMQPVTAPNQNILFPNIEINTDRLMNAIRLVMEFIERLTAASSYVLGRESEIVGGSGTATRTNAIMQSAEQRFQLPAERLRDGASRELKNHLDLLQLNIPPGLEERIFGEKGDPLFDKNELSQLGISGEFDAYILPDPSMGSAQTERDLSSMLYSVMLQNPIVASDPVKIYKFTADVLRANKKDPKFYLGPEPKDDMFDEPEDENTLILQGQFQKVRAQLTENHIYHIKKHQDLLMSPEMKLLPPNLQQEILQYTQLHIQEHQQMLSQMMSMATLGKGGKQNGGESGGDSENSQGAINQPLMENVPGPLGEAMDTKRKGEEQSTPSE